MFWPFSCYPETKTTSFIGIRFKSNGIRFRLLYRLAISFFYGRELLLPSESLILSLLRLTDISFPSSYPMIGSGTCSSLFDFTQISGSWEINGIIFPSNLGCFKQLFFCHVFVALLPPFSYASFLAWTNVFNYLFCLVIVFTILFCLFIWFTFFAFYFITIVVEISRGNHLRVKTLEMLKCASSGLDDTWICDVLASLQFVANVSQISFEFYCYPIFPPYILHLILRVKWSIYTYPRLISAFHSLVFYVLISAFVAKTVLFFVF